jgi:lupus La protein
VDFSSDFSSAFSTMAEEQKTPVVNAEAEKDVQNVLAELKEEGAAE